MKNVLFLLFALSLTSANVFANRRVFKQIEADAQVGNGHSNVVSYDTDIEKAALLAQGLKDLKSEYRKNCGPWKTITTRRTALRAIENLEEHDNDKISAKLQRLYDNDEIVAIVGALSNNDISCSLSYFNIYGSDGALLKLRYDMGD